MKHVISILLLPLLVFCGCRRDPSATDAVLMECIVRGDSTATARNFYEIGRRLLASADTLQNDLALDSALQLFLFASDYSRGASDHALRYDIQRNVAQLYETKNLFSLQQEYQRAMLEEARLLADSYRISEAQQQMAITMLVVAHASENPDVREALRLAHAAYTGAPRDSVEFRAETLLFLAQCHIAVEQTDSAAVFLALAQKEWPAVTDTDLYQLSSMYVCAHRGNTDEILRLVQRSSNPYTRMEAWRLVRDLAEERGTTDLQLQAADAMLVLTDTIAEKEASETTARIHAIQHADALRLMAARHDAAAASARAKWLAVLLLISLLLGGSAWWAMQMRRRSYDARMAELEALRIAAEAQQGEAAVREENMQLQKRYYDHLFAILLPILNACRKKRGHIDLSEQSWHLIEENTDLVLPEFTSKLRRQHPELSIDDIRFCCLVAMRVPNSVMAEVYAIAPSSVAVRKQRMKKKFDDRQAEQSLDNYLAQYS